MSGRTDSLQRRALLFGAIFDAAFALPMLLAPRPAAELLRLELPADMTWFRLAGVLLLIAAGCYASAAAAGASTRRRIALVAGGGRLLGCVVLLGAAWQGRGAALGVAGVLDGVLGLAHVALAARPPRA